MLSNVAFEAEKALSGGLPTDFRATCIICCSMRAINPSSLGTLATLVLVSCVTVPPVPEAPNAPVTSASYAAENSELVSPSPIEIAWWEGFSDPMLTALVNDALSENKSLAVAEANVAAATAILARQSLRRTYSTSTTASAELGRAARAGADTELGASGQLGASWEYDAFGRIASEIESAAFRVEQLDELRRLHRSRTYNLQTQYIYILEEDMGFRIIDFCLRNHCTCLTLRTKVYT